MVAVNPRKKQSVNLELPRGRGSKFPTRGSNRMLVVCRYCINFNSFIVDLFYLEDS